MFRKLGRLNLIVSRAKFRTVNKTPGDVLAKHLVRIQRFISSAEGYTDCMIYTVVFYLH